MTLASLTFQSLAVRSTEPEKSWLPSCGAKASAVIRSACPFNSLIVLPSPAASTRMTLSSPAAAIWAPSLRKAQRGDAGWQRADLLDLLAVVHRADPDELARQCDGGLVAIAVQGDRDDRLVVAADLPDELAIGGRPDPDDLVGARRPRRGSLRDWSRRPAPAPFASSRRGSATGSCQSRASPSEPAETSCGCAGDVGQTEHAVGGGLDQAVGGEIPLPEPDHMRLLTRGKLRPVLPPGRTGRPRRQIRPDP